MGLGVARTVKTCPTLKVEVAYEFFGLSTLLFSIFLHAKLLSNFAVDNINLHLLCESGTLIYRVL